MLTLHVGTKNNTEPILEELKRKSMAYRSGPTILSGHRRNLMYWKEMHVLSPPFVLLQHLAQSKVPYLGGK